jgi:hypothetical protein
MPEAQEAPPEEDVIMEDAINEEMEKLERQKLGKRAFMQGEASSSLGSIQAEPTAHKHA